MASRARATPRWSAALLCGVQCVLSQPPYPPTPLPTSHKGVWAEDMERLKSWTPSSISVVLEIHLNAPFAVDVHLDRSVKLLEQAGYKK